MTEDQQEWLAGLRELVTFLDEKPDLIPAYIGLKICRFGRGTKAEFAALALQLGPSAKSSDDTWFNVTRKFGPHEFEVTQRREDICERRVVGTDTTEVEEPDPEVVAALPKVKRTVTTEKVEWVCPPSLHALAAEQ